MNPVRNYSMQLDERDQGAKLSLADISNGAKKKTIALVVAEFHREIADVMVAEAKKEVMQRGGAVKEIIHVPGCFEMPLAVKRLLKKKTINAVVVLGYIEKGETLHGEVMGHVVHHTLMSLQLAFMKPIGFGIIGPGATEGQARLRMKTTARNAVRAVC